MLQKSGVEIPELPGNYSETLQRTLEECLACDSWNRPTAEKLVEIAEAVLQNESYLKSTPDYRNQTKVEEKGNEAKTIIENSAFDNSLTPKETINEVKSISDGGNLKMLFLAAGIIGIAVGVLMALLM